jgi:type I protein arginine methyltransferase
MTIDCIEHSIDIQTRPMIHFIQIVLDVGSGTCLLSMFAAKAGAKLVYAVDSSSNICRLAEELIQCNHLDDRIQIINERIEDIEKFDEPIDIIISEWMGKIRTY